MGFVALLLVAAPAAGEDRSSGSRLPHAYQAAHPSLIPVRALAVVDGRTIRVRRLGGKRRTYTVRLVGVAVSEDTCSGVSARKRLAEFLFRGNKGVRLGLKPDRSGPRFDGHGRLRAYAFRREGPSLQVLLLREGDLKFQGSKRLTLYGLLKKAELHAKELKLGIWKACPTPSIVRPRSVQEPSIGAAGLGVGPLPKRPNILFFVTDDQRIGSMDVMPKTLRWFANEGLTYSNAFVTTPLCCPSRSSIFSGRYTHNHGVLQNENRGELDMRYTMQHYLQAAGYTTAIVGKLVNYWVVCNNPPPYWNRHVLLSGVYSPFRVSEQDTCKNITDQYSTTYLKNQSLNLLNELTAGDKPWFLYVAPNAPHEAAAGIPPTPEPKYENAPVPAFQAPPSYFEKDLSDKPPTIRIPRQPPDKIQIHRTAALRTLMSVDDMVDEVMTALVRSGEADNTLVIFLSDNGYLLGEHGQVSKGSPYLEADRVPMFMRWPAQIPGGSVDNRIVANVDLLPTVLQATSTPFPVEPPLDGRSLLDPTWVRDRLLLEFWRDLTVPDTRELTFASLYSPTYQYTEWFQDDATTPLLWPTGEEQGGAPIREYYNLLADPWELTNVLHDGNAANDPPIEPLAAQLARDRRCAGQGSPLEEPPPCP
jgi:arylsulfatase A-like enzyme/endonuclease YncB( thermonuclease family)